MQRPKDLSREQLEQLADAVQQALYLDFDEETDAFAWDPDKEWSGFDVCAEISIILGRLSMIPEERKPF